MGGKPSWHFIQQQNNLYQMICIQFYLETHSVMQSVMAES